MTEICFKILWDSGVDNFFHILLVILLKAVATGLVKYLSFFKVFNCM